VLSTAEEEEVVVASADEDEVVVTSTAVEEVVGATLELVDTAVEVAARTEEHAACAALRTARASVAPQEESTQEVAAD